MEQQNPARLLFGLLILVFVGVVGWRIGGNLSSDAMGMAIGMLFGIMAGIPTALILLASERRHERPHDETGRQMRQMRDEINRLTVANHELVEHNRQLAEAGARLLNMHEANGTRWQVIE